MEIELRIPGHPKQAAINISYVLMSAASYLAREANFTDFQNEMLSICMNADPPRADMATWFLDMTPDHLADLARMLYLAGKDAQDE